MTLYLLDANILIRAHEDYYPLDRIPAFWSWLLHQGNVGTIKIPATIYNEIGPHNDDPLGRWARDKASRSALVLPGVVRVPDLQRVYVEGYRVGAVPTDADQDAMGRDPFLIAAALGGEHRRVVTREVSKPRKQGANRHVPDVCRDLGISVLTDFDLWRALDFRIP